MLLRLLLIAVLMVTSNESHAAARRAAIIDIETNDLSDLEKTALLSTIRERVDRLRIWSLVPNSEIESVLVESSSVEQEFRRDLEIADKAHQVMVGSIAEATALYRESEFDRALALLETAWSMVSEANLKLSAETMQDLFRLKGAVLTLLGDLATAKNVFALWKSVDNAAAIADDIFPPIVIETFQAATLVKALEKRSWTYTTPLGAVGIKYLGFRMEQSLAEDKASLELPLLVPDPGVVVERQGFRSSIFKLDGLPDQVLLQTLQTKRRSTKGLFAPTGQLAPHPELKFFVAHLKAWVLFLGSVTRKNDQFTLLGQWYEGPTGRLSEVREVSDAQLSQAIEALIGRMVDDISSDGTLREAGKSPETLWLQESSPKPFYKTWWFWTLSSLALAGAGIGTYLAVSKDDSFRFEVHTP